MTLSLLKETEKLRMMQLIDWMPKTPISQARMEITVMLFKHARRPKDFWWTWGPEKDPHWFRSPRKHKWTSSRRRRTSRRSRICWSNTQRRPRWLSSSPSLKAWLKWQIRLTPKPSTTCLTWSLDLSPPSKKDKINSNQIIQPKLRISKDCRRIWETKEALCNLQLPLETTDWRKFNQD